MEKQPTWTWRLRADADERRLVRWGYKCLRWCTDGNPLYNQLISFFLLLIGAIYVIRWIRPFFLQSTKASFVAGIAVIIVVLILALKGIVAHVTDMVFFRDKKFVGGAPTENRFERLVPRQAKQVALVGQNLVSHLKEKNYDKTLQSIQALLSRRDSDNKPSVEEFWLVVMTPLALSSVHPEAAGDLRSFTVKALERLANDLGEDAQRVQVAFHPAATLSMLVVDWSHDSRLAVVNPKVQTIAKIDHRLSVLLSSKEIENVAPEFDRFIDEVTSGGFLGADYVLLPDAAKRLQAMFDLKVVAYVSSYVERETA
uniref:Uncharacterized protein n=1 Tax=uncultured microorganism TaxID=358574 RepID=K0J3F3_9ZZZZ|nr:hypothetical protein [uncultured microorganism]